MTFDPLAHHMCTGVFLLARPPKTKTTCSFVALDGQMVLPLDTSKDCSRLAAAM